MTMRNEEKVQWKKIKDRSGQRSRGTEGQNEGKPVNLGKKRGEERGMRRALKHKIISTYQHKGGRRQDEQLRWDKRGKWREYKTERWNREESAAQSWEKVERSTDRLLESNSHTHTVVLLHQTSIETIIHLFHVGFLNGSYLANYSVAMTLRWHMFLI